MQILNIGPVELILVMLIMFILLGPEGMLRTARQIGAWIRKIIKSPVWREVMGYSRDLRDLPNKLVQETGLEEDLAEIQKITTDTSKEINQTINDTKQEVDQSIKEAGSVKVLVEDQKKNDIPQFEIQMEEDGKTEEIKPTPPSTPTIR